MSKMSTAQKIAVADAANVEAARIIAADPERYAGVMLEWARLLLSKRRAPQSALFDEAA